MSQHRFILAGTVLLLVSVGVVGCGHPPPGKAEQGLPEVTVSKPVAKPVTGYEYFTGRVTAIPVLEVRARVNGYLSKVFFKDGQEIKKDAKLFEIDRRPFQATLDEAKAKVEAALASEKFAKTSLGREQDLLAQRAGSQRDFDFAVGKAGEATAAVAAAEAAVKSAQINLDFTVIASEITGVASSTNVDPGNIVAADKTLLTTVVAVDPIYVEFNVDERTVLEVQEEMRKTKAKSTVDAAVPVWISMATDRGEFPHKATIDFIDNRVSTTTGTLRVRAALPNPPVNGQRRFSTGMFVRVKVPVTEARPRLLVVDRAIDSDLDQKFLYVVNEQKKVERRPVKLGPLHDGLRVVEPMLVVETKQGLRPAREGEKGVPSLREGEWVVINGLQLITSGVPVKTIEGKMAVGGDAE